MYKIFRSRPIQIIFICTLLISVVASSTVAQGPEEVRRPIDMFIVIDNSTSMFGPSGNDPASLRVVGADLFIARLGFGEINESEYQAGIISMGSSPELIAPLQPLEMARGRLAQLISEPPNAGGTQIIQSLEMAYRELRTSPDRRPGNLPAIVLLTDGVPDPPEGQSRSDIERLVTGNPDIPLFVMLLQNREGGSSREYQSYIRFWQELQGRSSHIFVYQVENAEQIENTYNQVVAQLQNTVPSEGFPVTPGEPVNIFVSRYVQRLIVTIVHERGEERGTVEITDPTGTVVMDADPEVSHFDDLDNPVEVVSIGPRRIGSMVDDVWTIQSDAPVMVFLDRQGAYRIDFVEPAVSLTDVTNVYLAVDRHSPSSELVIRFRLLDRHGEPIMEPQPIHGVVTHPDGSEAEMRIPADLAPNSEGVYEITYDYSTYPNALSESGRYTFLLEAGQANDREGERVPVTTSRLLVDSGRGAFIQDVTPSPVTCEEGAPATISVTVGDAETADMDTAVLRVFGGGAEVMLAPSGENTFEGDITDLCTELISNIACSSTAEASFHLRLVAQGIEGNTLAPSEQDVPVQVIGEPCPPTPSPTPLPPTPTPCPDRDGDGFDDCGADACPDEAGIERLDGCPIPWWVWLIVGILALGLLALFILKVIPWIRVRTFAKPPKGYVLVCNKGRREGPYSTYSIGMRYSTDKITIGGDRKKAHIYVAGLEKAVEFYVIKQGDFVRIFDAESDMNRGSFGPTPSDVSTSNPDIKLRIALNNRISC